MPILSPGQRNGKSAEYSRNIMHLWKQPMKSQDPPGQFGKGKGPTKNQPYMESDTAKAGDARLPKNFQIFFHDSSLFTKA